MLPAEEIQPTAPISGTVVWLHGLGADGHDFVPVAPLLCRPDQRFVFPHAPRRRVTINGGYLMRAWYDIRSMERGSDREDPADIAASHADLVAQLDREVARGVPPERIVLAGFSQGAAMALHTGLRYPRRLAGLVALSGYLVLEHALDAEAHAANAATPLFIGHGDRDDVVPVEAGHATFARLRTGRPADYHGYVMGHEVNTQEIVDLGQWLARWLPAPDAETRRG